MSRLHKRTALPLLCFACLLTSSALAQSSLETIVKTLTAPELNGRPFRSEGGRRAAEFIATQFRAAGLKPAPGTKEFLQAIDGGGQNVAGIIEGRSNEFILVGAHYDAFGGAFTGAMNNAAGVALLIDVARQAVQAKPQRGMLFIAFDGGEQRRAGEKFYAAHPLVSVSAAIKLAGFGGGISERLYETLYIIGAEYAPQLAAVARKHKDGEAHLALVSADITAWPGGEQFEFARKNLPAVTITNGVHYAYSSKADTPNRINFAALNKQAAALAKLLLEIANTPGKFERTADPAYDADEAAEWVRVLTALRENVLKTPDNDAGQRQIDDLLLELKRQQNRPVQDRRAREATVLRAANIAFYIANPNGVEYARLEARARQLEQSGDRAGAAAAYRQLLKFIDEEYRRDDQTVADIRARLAKVQ